MARTQLHSNVAPSAHIYPGEYIHKKLIGKEVSQLVQTVKTKTIWIFFFSATAQRYFMTGVFQFLFVLHLSVHLNVRANKVRCPTDIFQVQLPQFQIVSAAKTGSTSLYSYLCGHSSIQCLAKRKELNLLRNKAFRMKTAKVRKLEVLCFE